jgi:3-mercaptopyruvate sulfurtransferase SseA
MMARLSIQNITRIIYWVLLASIVISCASHNKANNQEFNAGHIEGSVNIDIPDEHK